MKAWRFESKKLLEVLGGTAIKECNVTLDDVATVTSPRDNCLMFATTKKFKRELIANLININNSCILIEPELENYFSEIASKNLVISIANSRLYFAKALKVILSEYNKGQNYIKKDNNVMIGVNTKIGDGCNIEPGVFIDNNVEIGKNVIIKAGAIIRQYVIVRDNSVVGENTVIGGQGFGVEKDIDGKNIRIPHIGGVVIGENVEIGALASIASGTIAPTIIEDNCFIDDLVHIGHNCNIGNGTMITACAQFGGSSRIGNNGFVAPNSTIRNGVELGNNCFVGQASSIQKSYDDNVSLVGNPARQFERK